MASLLDRIHREGPVPYSAFVEWSLYDDEIGFYTSGAGRAGRREGDFLTSPEVGPLFGAVVARAVDAWWRALGSPDPFAVVEAGAGPATLARTVLAAEPACAGALRWVLVERSPAQRAGHGEHLPLVPPSMAFAPEEDDSPAPHPRGRGPLVVSLSSLPRLAAPCVVLANELLDNLPFDLWERRGDEWWEVRVGAAGEGGGLAEVVLPGEAPAWLGAIEADDGARVPVQGAARAWLREALALARLEEGGRVVAFDYCSTTPELARRAPADWLRTYRGHQRGGPPLETPGSQDITAEVCLDQLALVRAPVRSTQAAWLRTWGIDDLVAEAGAARSSPARDLRALRVRSRLSEAPLLLDPAGLGAFTVAEWT